MGERGRRARYDEEGGVEAREDGADALQLHDASPL